MEYVCKRNEHILRLHFMFLKHFPNLRKNIYLAVTCDERTYAKGTVPTHHTEPLKMLASRVLEQNEGGKNQYLIFVLNYN